MAKSASFESRKARAFKELAACLGEENVSENPAVRSSYRWSWGFVAVAPYGKGPELVVMPRTVEHVQEIVRLANKEKLTVLPICAGSLTPSFEADILIDMMKMDRIIKIDPESSYVVLEPGVTYNRLIPLLRKEGYTIAIGSFPPTFSPVGNLAVQQGFNHNFSGRVSNQTLGLEIVMLDGSLLRTGTASMGSDYWSPQAGGVPDIRGLFATSLQATPLMGIVTKAAIRIWPLMEASGLPIGGFDTFAKAVKFSKTVTQSCLGDQSMVWNWVLTAMTESHIKGSKDHIDLLTHRMTADYTEPYKGLYYCYAWTQFRGYKEQVDCNLKLCERIAKEIGGKILGNEELGNTIPNCWKSWKRDYKDFDPLAEKREKHMWSYMGGERPGGGSAYFNGSTDDLIKLEDAFNRTLRDKYNQNPQPYYVRMFEGGTGAHLRYMLPVDAMDEYHRKRVTKMREEMSSWVNDNFPNIHVAGGYKRGGYKKVETHSIGMGSALNRIRDALDPNHVGFLPGEKRLEPDEEGKAVTAG